MQGFCNASDIVFDYVFDHFCFANCMCDEIFDIVFDYVFDRICFANCMCNELFDIVFDCVFDHFLCFAIVCASSGTF